MPTPKEIIDRLSHGQALAILQALAVGDEQLANRIAELVSVRKPSPGRDLSLQRW
jgi:DNA-binding transcriptional ArsR family regulator